ncbi:organomercurial lyase MerB [Sporichthya polymorpha]|uniref:organomercurial lyase MerB n=1 Tax=Sporichthya polymorpha TaxID=35751 RepID=UPI0003615CE8|nr:organomercurial lyase MerB [Sporichthya polymorpha]
MSTHSHHAETNHVDSGVLATRLAAAFNGGGASRARPWLWRPLLQLLARGEPVSLDRIAEATGRTPEQVREALAANPDTEYDVHGHVVGSGLTQNPTPHCFEVDGRSLYTWCALDTLIFPTVLDRPAQVMSPTPGSGELVRVGVDPIAGITSLDPVTAVVSVLIPGTGAGVRASFCNQVHFFAAPTLAAGWLTEHPGGVAIGVADAFELGRRLARDLAPGTPSAAGPHGPRPGPASFDSREGDA